MLLAPGSLAALTDNIPQGAPVPVPSGDTSEQVRSHFEMEFDGGDGCINDCGGPDPCLTCGAGETIPRGLTAGRLDRAAVFDLLAALQGKDGEETGETTGLDSTPLADAETAIDGGELRRHPWARDGVTAQPFHGTDDEAGPAPQSQGADRGDAGNPTTAIMAVGAAVATASLTARVALVATGGGAALGSLLVARRLGGLRGVFAFLFGLTYSKNLQKEIEHPARREILELIRKEPGIQLGRLCELTGLGTSTVVYHVRRLERCHAVVSKRHGRGRHFYENGGSFDREQKDALAILQNDRTRDIAEYIRANPGTMQKSILEAMGISSSLAVWHLKRLVATGVVDARRRGRVVHYVYLGAERRVRPQHHDAVPMRTPVLVGA